MGTEILTLADFQTFETKLKTDLDAIKAYQRDIFDRLNRLSAGEPVPFIQPGYITAYEFMNAVHIRRWKFNQLIANNKIKTIKKSRRIYVPIAEVKRFFIDPSIQ
jgi:hypothetical protein